VSIGVGGGVLGIFTLCDAPGGVGGSASKQTSPGLKYKN